MNNVSRERIFTDLQTILNELIGDWEYSGEISLETSFFQDLGFESIDVVAFGTAIEEHYRQSFPFAKFLAGIAEREVRDIQVGDIVEFIHQNLGIPSQ